MFMTFVRFWYYFRGLGISTLLIFNFIFVDWYWPSGTICQDKSKTFLKNCILRDIYTDIFNFDHKKLRWLTYTILWV